VIKRVALLSMILLLSLSTPVLAAEPGSGVIEGQLVNGTQGGSSVADQTVTLTSYLNAVEAGTTNAKTGTDGRFVFKGLSTSSGNSHRVKLKYQEADYSGEPFALTDNETTKSTILTVYDSTSSDGAVSVTTAFTIVAFGQDGLEVTEHLVFANDSDRAYIGSGEITSAGGKRTLKLPSLPTEATDLQYGGELVSGRVLPDFNGLFDTMAMLPGEKTAIYSYRVSVSSDSYKFVRKVDYPVASYSFLVQGENTRATSSRLAAGQIVDFQGIKFNILSADNIASGETIDIQLSGLSQAGNQTGSDTSGSNQQTILLVTLAVVLAAGGGAGFVYLLKKRNLQSVSLENNPEQLKQELLIEIAELDDDFESGKIKKETYSKLRAEMKSQLVELMQDSQEESGSG